MIRRWFYIISVLAVATGFLTVIYPWTIWRQQHQAQETLVEASVFASGSKDVVEIKNYSKVVINDQEVEPFWQEAVVLSRDEESHSCPWGSVLFVSDRGWHTLTRMGSLQKLRVYGQVEGIWFSDGSVYMLAGNGMSNDGMLIDAQHCGNSIMLEEGANGEMEVNAYCYINFHNGAVRYDRRVAIKKLLSSSDYQDAKQWLDNIENWMADGSVCGLEVSDLGVVRFYFEVGGKAPGSLPFINVQQLKHAWLPMRTYEEYFCFNHTAKLDILPFMCPYGTKVTMHLSFPNRVERILTVKGPCKGIIMPNGTATIWPLQPQQASDSTKPDNGSFHHWANHYRPNYGYHYVLSYHNQYTHGSPSPHYWTHGWHPYHPRPYYNYYTALDFFSVPVKVAINTQSSTVVYSTYAIYRSTPFGPVYMGTANGAPMPAASKRVVPYHYPGVYGDFYFDNHTVYFNGPTTDPEYAALLALLPITERIPVNASYEGASKVVQGSDGHVTLIP